MWPRGLPLPPRHGHSSEGVMEVGDDGDVPGATGQGTCEEMALVVDEMGNDHLKDVLGKFGDGGRTCCGNLYRSTAGTLLDSG